MSRLLRLTISTPEAQVVDGAAVWSVRAMDESGSFGILPGHADLLTVLPSSLVRWRTAEGEMHLCAVRGGVLTVSEGDQVAIACREAKLGNRLDALESEIIAARESELEADRRARVAEARMHARAVRHLMRYLMHDGSGGVTEALTEYGK
jgi:F-type H+-transporting ATPase subunit epsilon